MSILEEYHGFFEKSESEGIKMSDKLKPTETREFDEAAAKKLIEAVAAQQFARAGKRAHTATSFEIEILRAQFEKDSAEMLKLKERNEHWQSQYYSMKSVCDSMIDKCDALKATLESERANTHDWKNTAELCRKSSAQSTELAAKLAEDLDIERAKNKALTQQNMQMDLEIADLTKRLVVALENALKESGDE